MSRALWVYGGGSSADLDAITASASDVLSGKVIVDKEGNPLTGTMPNMGAVSQTLNCGQTYTIPAGYHTGSGKIVANSLASQTSATATAAAILKGKTAWVNGSRITGSIPSHAAGSFNPDLGKSKTIIAAGNYLQNPVVLNGFTLPPANKLAQGYTYSIYGHSVTGTAGVIPTGSTRYLLKNGQWQEGGGSTRLVARYGVASFESRSSYIYLSVNNGDHDDGIVLGASSKMAPIGNEDLSKYYHLYLEYYVQRGTRVSSSSYDSFLNLWVGPSLDWGSGSKRPLIMSDSIKYDDEGIWKIKSVVADKLFGSTATAGYSAPYYFLQLGASSNTYKSQNIIYVRNIWFSSD